MTRRIPTDCGWCGGQGMEPPSGCPKCGRKRRMVHSGNVRRVRTWRIKVEGQRDSVYIKDGAGGELIGPENTLFREGDRVHVSHHEDGRLRLQRGATVELWGQPRDPDPSTLLKRAANCIELLESRANGGTLSRRALEFTAELRAASRVSWQRDD